MRKGIKVLVAGVLSLAFLVPQTKLVMAGNAVETAKISGIDLRASSYIYNRTGGATTGAVNYSNRVNASVGAFFTMKDLFSGMEYDIPRSSGDVSYAAVTMTADGVYLMVKVRGTHTVYIGSDDWNASTLVTYP